MKGNFFVCKLLDIIVAKEKDDGFDNCKGLFLIMENWPTDLKKITSAEGSFIEEEHLKVLIYNSLCSLHYIHSANIIHRDIKSANILNNELC